MENKQGGIRVKHSRIMSLWTRNFRQKQKKHASQNDDLLEKYLSSVFELGLIRKLVKFW